MPTTAVHQLFRLVKKERKNAFEKVTEKKAPQRTRMNDRHLRISGVRYEYGWESVKIVCKETANERRVKKGRKGKQCIKNICTGPL